MSKRSWFGLVFWLLVFGLVICAGCSKKQVVSEPGLAPPPSASQAPPSAVAPRSGATDEELEKQRIEEERLREEARARKAREALAAREQFENEHIYFDYDKAILLPEAKEVLRRKAKWLRANGTVSIVIEGHCDERGTAEYNMALGDRRARSAKTFLVDLGIAPKRITCVSYGEERPVDPGHDERAWAKNRRAEFVTIQ